MSAKVCLGARTYALPSKIIQLRADKNYTHIYFSDGSSMLSSTNLGVLEERLAECNFFRVNRSILVNLDYGSRFLFFQKPFSTKNKSKGNKIQVKVSRRRLADLHQCYPNLTNQLWG